MNEVIKFAKDFLTLSENVMFYYNCETNMLRLFWIINRDDVVEISNMDFDEWVDNMIAENRVVENDISIFKIFCNAVKYCIAKATYSFHTNILSPDNTFCYCKVSFFPKITDNERYVLGQWLVINEFTGNYIENYTYGSYVDPLTGVFNKQSIIDYAKKRVEDTSFSQCALILINLDDFSRINANYGHKFGDQLLKAVAEVIRSVIGIHGVEGRFGGDEFMIVLNDAADELIIRNYLRAIKTNVTMLYRDILGENCLTCSIGVARSRLNSNNYDELFKIVKRVLYIAKQKGKNRYIIYKPEMHGQIITRDDSANNDDTEKTSDTDLYKCAKLLLRVVTDGTEMLPRLLEQLSRTLMVDRILIFWGRNYDLIATSNPEFYGKEVYPRILDDRLYLEQFSDDMIFIGDVETIKTGLPNAYHFFKDLGVSSTMQHLLRNREGRVTGIVVADECQSDHEFSQIVVQTFSFICKVINGILLNQ